MSRKIIILDFDRTTFDTWLFADKVTEIFRTYGKVEPHVTSLYDRDGGYTIEKHLELVQTKTRKKAVKKHLRILFRNLDKLVFSDAWDFIEWLFVENRLFLVTKGEKHFQQKKVYCALGKETQSAFEKIIITDDNKVRSVQEIILNNPKLKSFAIDDKLEELAAFKKAFPEIMTILIARKHLPANEEFHNFSPNFIVNNLLAAFYIIAPEAK